MEIFNRCAIKANIYAFNFTVTQSDQMVATQNYLTEAGSYSASASHQGTFDQGGNVYEWNDAVSGSFRGKRGGCWNGIAVLTGSDRRETDNPSFGSNLLGFRVAGP